MRFGCCRMKKGKVLVWTARLKGNQPNGGIKPNLGIRTEASVKKMKAESESAVNGLQPGNGKAVGGFRTDCMKLQTDIGWGADNLIVVWTAVGGVGVAGTGLSL